MSHNGDYFNRRGVTKCSCVCTSLFQFDSVSISSTVLTVQNTGSSAFPNLRDEKREKKFKTKLIMDYCELVGTVIWDGN
jgi:hypothetical protein